MKIGKFYIELRSPIHITSEKPYMREIRQALAEENTLMAIKIYKDATGSGLRESKDFIIRLRDKEFNQNVVKIRSINIKIL